jgi:phage protein D
MDRSRPFIEVSVDGRPVSGLFYERLVKATIHDAPGQEADTLEITLDDAGNQIEIPATGARLAVTFGFRDAPSWKMGVFAYEKWAIEGGDGGEFVTLSGRSADMAGDLKEPGTEHFDDTTVGAIVQELAGRHGYAAKVDAEFGSMQLPYLARYQQSTIDLLTRLADRTGALFSVKGETFLFVRRGRNAPILIDRSECSDWSFNGEPRPRYGKTAGGWLDRDKGEVRWEEHATGIRGPARRLRNLLPGQGEAKAAAKAEGDRLGRATGAGTVTMAGRPEYMADQPVVLTGFRRPAAGLWRCAGVDHQFDDTYTTSIALEAPESGKGGT